MLVALRHKDSHQGGFWEFPGGKVEANEGVERALCREFQEELGIEVQRCFPLKKITHQYADKSVLLDVWSITEFSGEPQGREGQKIEWRAISDLRRSDFPAANAAIVRCLQLPRWLAITPDCASFEELNILLLRQIDAGCRMIQIRQTALSATQYVQWFDQARIIAADRGISLLFNQDIAFLPEASEIGFHVNSDQLMSLAGRPANAGSLFSASCHSLQQLQKAEALDADFAVLSPLHETSKYQVKGAAELGWQGFQELAAQVSIPVYALGSVTAADLAKAREHGAAGIAGIKLFL